MLPLLLILFTNSLLNPPITSIKLGKGFVSILSLLLVCEGSRYIINRVRRMSLTSRSRHLLTIGIGILFSTVVLAASKLIRQYISTGRWDFGTRMESQVYINNNQLTLGLFSYAFANAVINFLFLYIVYEVLFHYAKLHHTEKQNEALEKEKLKAELNQLKGIVNPHFLFNNLNSLSALISEDPVKADIFLDELTKVFRYLLRNNDTELTTLASELQFIQSYYHLLQIRYGEAINMHMQVEEEDDKMLIPPLTLQLLVENAVKHNQVLKQNPLQISLYSAPGNTLVIKNNIARKESSVESTGIGLQNINSRYRMLKRPGIKIEQDDQYFSVIISLIN